MITQDKIPQLTCQPNYRTDIPFSGFTFAMDRYLEMGLDTDPDFQRGHVWKPEQKVKWIEFLLKGGKPYSDVILNHPGWMKSYKGHFVVVDGKQRLTAIFDFLADKFPVFAGLEGKTEGWKASEIEESAFRRVSIGVAVNNLQKREDVLRWYLELNEGAIAHTPDELARVKGLLAEEQNRVKPQPQATGPELA